ncbi:hypothetical protein DNH61_12535 [Paenibacillus sambharensis]|uniref:Uncharacterized protein n=1 Tax=Paenibacillus sambharensis TaxID=1803190 RepID=A0A2W1L8X2_9BACL|nr:hypothetical protein [Paenibacillus sambharensis]PZD95363.1 hypothetical protein DNH61_12535 [Paenibacillus sambharensis]
MSYEEMLDRRSEILKRNIGTMILKENQQGLSGQENHLYQNMIKELHQTENELNTKRNES